MGVLSQLHMCLCVLITFRLFIFNKKSRYPLIISLHIYWGIIFKETIQTLSAVIIYSYQL